MKLSQLKGSCIVKEIDRTRQSRGRPILEAEQRHKAERCGGVIRRLAMLYLYLCSMHAFGVIHL